MRNNDVRSILAIPGVPALPARFPAVVSVCDRIRFALDRIDGLDCGPDFGELSWFLREYPRCYRYHLDCAEFRLESIRSLYEDIYAELVPKLSIDAGLISVGIANERATRIYWDFESFLSEVNISLDLLARVAGSAYREQLPPNFNRFCKAKVSGGPVEVMRKAQVRWINRLKDYRDCFTHYTPVDTLLSVGFAQYADGFEFRARIPVNPNMREILGFRFNRRTELLRYACSVWRHMIALDKAVAKVILSAYLANEYPVRTSGLFFLGRRDR